MNPYLLEMELKERQREMLDEAKRQQLLRLYRNQPSKGHGGRLLLAIADLLIELGETLKRRHRQEPVLASGDCRKP